MVVGLLNSTNEKTDNEKYKFEQLKERDTYVIIYKKKKKERHICIGLFIRKNMNFKKIPINLMNYENYLKES